MNNKKFKIFVVIFLILYYILLICTVNDGIKTYEEMTVDERIRTEQMILPGW